MNKEITGIEAEGSISTTDLSSGKSFITGEGGGGKGGGSPRQAVEADNTLRSAAVVRVVEVISEGQIVGISGGARGILINNTPLENADGTYNFPRVLWDYRVGLPSQSYMPGFPSASAEISLGAPIVIPTPAVYTVSDSSVDTLLFTIQLPQGLANQDMTNGDINGSTVQFRVDVKRTVDTNWQVYKTYTITGKTMSPYEAQYRIEKPMNVGSGVWDIRITRLTANSTSSSLRNAIQLQRVTEVIDAKLSYDDTAIIGLAIDAESVGSSIPTRAYQVRGIIVQVPSNYDPVTRVYDGIWDGTFKNAWTNNTAWIVYDLLTHPRYGMGEFVKPSMIDKYSFYDAAVYNDGLVDDGEGGTEPRFTFDGYINAQQEAYKLIQLVAGSMRAKVLEINGKWTVLQDRPSSVVRIITNADVEDGLFTYASTGLFERHTAVNITWNDRSDRYLQKTSVWEVPSEILKYGYVPLDVAAYGQVKESAALRHGKWTLETEHNETEMVSFVMSLNGFDLLPNEIVEIFDEDYTQVQKAGRVQSVTGRNFIIDRNVTLTAGDKLVVMAADWKTVLTYDIDVGNSDDYLVRITVDPAAIGEKAPYYIRSIVTARPFKILNLTFSDDEEQDNRTVKVDALNYDATKYARVETGLSVAPPVFSNTPTNSTVVLRPLDITFTEDAVVNTDDTIQRRLIVGWRPNPEGSPATSYIVSWNKDGDNMVSETVMYPGIVINVYGEGVYRFWVLAKDGQGRVSGTSLTGMKEVTSATAGDSTAVVNIRVKGTNALIFNTADLTFMWDPNALGTFVPDYVITVKTSGGIVLRELITADLEYTYTLQHNRQDSAVFGLLPQGQLVVTITPRNAFGQLGTATTVTFTNPAPASVQNFIATVGFKSAQIFWDKPSSPDVAGYLVWRSTVAGFTPSDVTFLADTTSTSYTDANLSDSQFYYYQVAAYDVFTRNTDGTGLNFSGVQGGKTASGASINEYLLTETVFEVDIAQDVVQWTAGQVSATLGSQSGTTWAVNAGTATWTSGVLYIYYKAGDDHLSSSTLLSAVAFDDVVVVATYRGGARLEVGMGNSYTDGSLIIAGTISSAQLAVGSVTADKVTITNLSALSADLGIITGGQMNINNKFIVDAQGNMTATSGVYSGDLLAAGGTFGGTLMAGVLDTSQMVGFKQMFTTPGTYYYTVPPGKEDVRFTICPGSGGGGGGGGGPSYIGGGGGGGGGAKATVVTLPIPAGTVITVVVGSGGAGGAINGNGGNGTLSRITSSVTGVITANPAAGGSAGPRQVLFSASAGDQSVGGGAGGAGGNGGGAGGTGGTSRYARQQNGMTSTLVAAVRGGGGAGGTGLKVGGSGGFGQYGQFTMAGDDTSAQPGLPGRDGYVIIESFNGNAVVLQETYDELISLLYSKGVLP